MDHYLKQAATYQGPQPGKLHGSTLACNASMVRNRNAFPRDRAAAPAPATVVGDLQRWGHGWTADDSGWQRVRLDERQLCNGFAMRYSQVFSAMYASRGTIWFQAGPRAWDAAQILRVVQQFERVRSVAYELHLANDGVERVKLVMPAPVVAERLLDPTYDELDSWADDILKLFPYVASDGRTALTDTDVRAWVHRFLPVWEAGVKHGP